MKSEKIINELNQYFDSLEKYQSKRQEKLMIFHKQFKTEEKKLRKELSKQTNQVTRKKLKKKLGVVKKAYGLLGS